MGRGKRLLLIMVLGLLMGAAGLGELVEEDQEYGHPISLDYTFTSPEPDATAVLAGSAVINGLVPRYIEKGTGLFPLPTVLDLLYFEWEGFPPRSGLDFSFGFPEGVSLSFAQDGFRYVELTVEDLISLSGISLDAFWRWADSGSVLGFAPKVAGLEGMNFEVYLDAQKVFQGELDADSLIGYRASYKIADDLTMEIVNAFDAEKMERILEEDIFLGEEPSQLRVGFVIPGRQGDEPATLGIFLPSTWDFLDGNRLGTTISVPLLPGLSFTTFWDIKLGEGTNLGFGWSFTF